MLIIVKDDNKDICFTYATGKHDNYIFSDHNLPHVADALREALGFLEGEGPGPLPEWVIQEWIDDAVLAERERCAKLCDEEEKRLAADALINALSDVAKSHAIGASICAYSLAIKIRRGEP